MKKKEIIERLREVEKQMECMKFDIESVRSMTKIEGPIEKTGMSSSYCTPNGYYIPWKTWAASIVWASRETGIPTKQIIEQIKIEIRVIEENEPKQEN